MKRIARRSILLWALLIAFLAGLSFMVLSLVTNADEWVMKRNNQHLFQGGQLSTGGSILDKYGNELIKNVDGKRVYSTDTAVRKATLHAVGDPVGAIATGVQSVNNSQLTGYNLFSGVYKIKKSGKGNDITLNLDSKACAVAYKKLDGKKGTIGVFNYKTGEIVCMVSAPSYDPNSVPADIDDNPEYEGAYINRLLKGLYAPGSSFKTVVSLCAIENIPDIFERTWQCDGQYDSGEGIIICNAVHGKIDFKTSLAQSCNSAFAQIAIELGAEKLTSTVNETGLTSTVTVDGVTCAKGQFDVMGMPKGELGWAGIGQSTVMVNPLKMMQFIGAIANGGKSVEPRLIKGVSNSLNMNFLSGKTEQLFSAENASTLKDMMRNNVMTNYGEKRYSGLNLCAKSGTAQIDGKGSTAWFAGFMDDVENPYAFVVVIEEGGSGSQVAGPVAGAVLNEIVSNAKK